MQDSSERGGVGQAGDGCDERAAGGAEGLGASAQCADSKQA